jgi:tetratricopeptide (TPR) repeat protein
VAEGPGNASQLKRKAFYGLACTYGLRSPDADAKRASEFLRRILDEPSQDDMSAWSLLLLARMEHLVPVGQEPDYGRVCKAYQAVIDRYPDHLAGKEAFIYLQAFQLATLREEETRHAAAALEKFAAGSSPEFVGSAHSLLAVAYTTLGNPAKRLAAEINSLETTEIDPTNPFTEFAWAYWNIATIAEFETGDFTTARKYYRRLIDEYPTDIRTYGARQALLRMDAVEARVRAEVARP